MGIDFRTYTDPGVYVEAVAPPIMFNPAIEPTILAIVGPGATSRQISETAIMSSTTLATLINLGVDPSSLRVKDRLLGTQFISAALGELTTAIDNVTTTLNVSVYSGVIVPNTPFSIRVEDETMTVTSIAGSTWTVTRSSPVSHGAFQVINETESYSATPSVWVATLSIPVGSTVTTFDVVPSAVVQNVYTTATSGTFTLTYDGQTTSNIAYNATAAQVQSALEALSNIDPGDVAVTGNGTSAVPWTVQFKGPKANNGIMLIINSSGLTGGTGFVYRRGVKSDSYLEAEGERMKVTSASDTKTNDLIQTVTVERGVRGTTAGAHGAVAVFENTGADYYSRIGAGADGTYGNGDDTLSLLTLDTTRIPNGTNVLVLGNATDATQFAPTLLDDMDSVVTKYGVPFASDGTINSPLSLAAQLAFANGATRLVLVATDPADTNPIQKGLDKLASESVVNSIVILSGASADHAYLKGHVTSVSEAGFLRRGFIGLAGTPTIQDHINLAQQMSSERITVVGPARFLVHNGTETPSIVPGYFAAAAVAGRQAGLQPQEPLTRKQLFGFMGIDGQASTSEILRAQSFGVTMLYEDRFGRIVIKHGLTTLMSNVYTREISVVTARDRLRDVIFDTLDQSGLIGSAMTPESVNLVVAGVESALGVAVRSGLIFDYSDVKYRVPTNEPTTIEVRFAYRPIMPLNYILVQFAIDTQTGSIEFQSLQESPV